MIRTKLAWATAVYVGLVSVACGSSVTVDQTGGGATNASSSAGPDGGAGGAVLDGGAGGFGAAGGAGGFGAGGAGASGGAGGAATCPGAGDVCTECLSTDCAGIYCDCYDEIHCGGYLQCLGTCASGDTACAQNCATVHEPGVSAAILVADCAATACDASCNFGQPLSACQKCLYSDCSFQMNACIADPECIALLACIQACGPGDMACTQACLAQHPDGLPEAQAVRECRDDNCMAACN